MLRRLRKKLKDHLLERWQLPHSPIAGLPPCIYFYLRDYKQATIVDIGAHRGQFTLGVQQLCEIRSALLVEPIEELATQLKRQFNDPRFVVADCALADKVGNLAMNVFPNAPYMSSLLHLDDSVEGHSVLAGGHSISDIRPIRTLDDVVAETKLRTIDLIKLDVQGAEHLVLSGGQNTLTRTSAVFTEVSFRPLYHGSCVFSDIYSLLRAKGFYMVALEPGFADQSGELLQADALFFNQRLDRVAAHLTGGDIDI